MEMMKGSNLKDIIAGRPLEIEQTIELAIQIAGSNGYFLRLIGLEDGFNSNAFDRAVVLHGAWYVSEDMIKTYGRIGRSWGCPAVRKEIAPSWNDVIKDGSILVVYYPKPDWLQHSAFLHSSQK